MLTLRIAIRLSDDYKNYTAIICFFANLKRAGSPNSANQAVVGSGTPSRSKWNGSTAFDYVKIIVEDFKTPAGRRTDAAPDEIDKERVREAWVIDQSERIEKPSCGNAGSGWILTTSQSGFDVVGTRRSPKT